MRLIGTLFSVCSVVSLAAGCGLQEAKSVTADAHGGMAIVDLDAVAKRLGRDVEISEGIQKKQAELNGELARYQTALNEDLAGKRQEFGETPTTDQTQEINKYSVQLNMKLTAAQRKAQATLEAYKQNLIGRFREDVKPVAQEVASAKGFSGVLPKNDLLVLTFEPEVDITNAVIERMKAGLPPAAAASKPAAPTASASAEANPFKADKTTN